MDGNWDAKGGAKGGADARDKRPPNEFTGADGLEGLFSMNAAFRSSDLLAHPHRSDIAALPTRDRAVLRLLYRMEAATVRQLTDLAYRRARKGQYRLQQLWQLRLTERTRVATDHAGAPPYVHRLTYRVRQRLGYRTPQPQITSRLRHLLDSHDVVCSLAQPTSHAPDGPMQAWLTAPMAAKVFGGRVEPDGVVVLQLREQSAVLCIAAQLRDRSGWHLLFVVPGRERLMRIQRLARRPGLAMLRGHAWVTLLADVRRRGLTAETYPAWSTDAPIPMATLIDDERDRGSAAPVGSDEWLTMLATGGVEDFDRLLAGTENPSPYRSSSGERTR